MNYYNSPNKCVEAEKPAGSRVLLAQRPIYVLISAKIILCNGGLAAFSWGESAGENRAEKAVEMAISSPLLCGYDLKKCKENPPMAF